MAAWRIAESLKKLRSQIDAAYPKRSKASDGAIGDEAHQSSDSDHNPWVRDGDMGIVTAIDITHSPQTGFDADDLARALVAARDKRIKYIIWDRRMVSSYKTSSVPAWTWRPYKGKNPHSKHIHISVSPEKKLYDSRQEWTIDVPVSRAAAVPVDDIQHSSSQASLSSPPAEPVIAEPAKETSVIVTDGNVKVETSEGAKPAEKVAIEKPPAKEFGKTIKKDLAAVTGGNVGVQTVREVSEAAGFLGLSPRFWVWISITAVVVGAAYLVMRYLKHKEEVKRDMEITNQLIAANTSPENKVVLVDAEKIPEFEERGYQIVRR